MERHGWCVRKSLHSSMVGTKWPMRGAGYKTIASFIALPCGYLLCDCGRYLSLKSNVVYVWWYLSFAFVTKN